jgi:hypothetical protein
MSMGIPCLPGTTRQPSRAMYTRAPSFFFETPQHSTAHIFLAIQLPKIEYLDIAVTELNRFPHFPSLDVAFLS